MIEETTKHHWLRIGAIVIMTFIIAFLAFYIVMEIMINRIANPYYQAKQMEKVLIKQEQNMNKFYEQEMNNPFVPKMRPTIVNLVKEPNEYKVIVDLTALDGNENAVSFTINNNELTITGEVDKKIRGEEKIIKFTQTYYLEEKFDENQITKEKKGNKYIITLPFKITNNNN